ncbi:MAG: hypothetical protein KAH17_02785 [Bacteroidales bacterium]|nr:hypothetical protein [Bacteroidales bacterium]
MKQLILLLSIILSCSSAFAQVSKKEALEKKIKSVAEWETNVRGRKSKPVQESFTKYNEAGKTLEIIERNNSGEVTLHEKYEYDEAGNKTTEIQMNSHGAVVKKHVYSYENNLRTSRKTYGPNGKLIAEKMYIYEFFKID